ncbi:MULTISPECIES: DUF7117 family protein [Halolamina]|uniref:TFIIB-type zinc ribbon-containing protein n=1 Tax=Halolamina pelagica TaxID=699431 RepID=A0A1I5VCY6_9EURY|nr:MULTISPECIES: hypothetical protein [Halolamina]NHX37688.1 TFIIB-type zinc ribbon-containing protein [Halolamina sp. R1-12]SFQ05428.1 hypothetical protein SAMN05216277_11736 [Halolamina pelagica]
MKIRGERECKNCGTRWSYYETGETACPDCGSLRSVAVDDERRRHTDSPAEIDLTPHRSALGDGADLVDVAEGIESDCRAYLRKRGFIRKGELLPLDDTFLAVQELRAALADYRRAERVGGDRSVPDRDAAEGYLLDLVQGADSGERPAPAEVPEALAPARGLAYATAIGAYREDVATYLDDEPDEDARRLLGRIRDQQKRLDALGGDLPPETVESLVRACRDLERYLNGEEGALATARQRLDELD